MANNRISRDLDVVCVTPALATPPTNLLNDRMDGCVKVLPGVFPRRRVAAADVATGQTQTQAHPLAASFQTLFAPFCVGCHIPNLIKVLAFCHVIILSCSLL